MSSTLSDSDSKTSGASAAAVVLSREAVSVKAACAAVALLPITNQAELDELGAGVKSVKARLKEIEAWRQSYTAPLLDRVEVYREQARPVEAAYRALEQAIKARMLRYRTECQLAEDTARAAAHAAQEQARLAAQAGQGQAAAALQHQAFTAMQSAAPALTTAGVATVRHWAIKVTRPELVPERFKVVDEAAFLAHVRETYGKASEAKTVPDLSEQGVSLYMTETIRA